MKSSDSDSESSSIPEGDVVSCPLDGDGGVNAKVICFYLLDAGVQSDRGERDERWEQAMREEVMGASVEIK